MSTDTFDIPRTAFRDGTDDTAPTLTNDLGPSRPRAGWRPVVADRIAQLLAAGRAGATRSRSAAMDATDRATRRRRAAVEATAVRANAVKLPSLDLSIVAIWSLAVALVAVEIALVVSPLAGIVVALAEGIALGASGQRLLRLVAPHLGHRRS
jgi:hypothetical protein